jgi:mannose-6-phosphate isomerase-like protein (cupin superfamily)
MDAGARRGHAPRMNQTIGAPRTIVVRGNPIVVLAASSRVSAFDYTAPVGFAGPPLHVHPGFDELFTMLQGTLTLRIEDDVTELGPGQSAYVAGTVAHTFANAGAEPARFVVSCTPGGWEDYFQAVADGDDAAAQAAGDRFGYAPSPAIFNQAE